MSAGLTFPEIFPAIISIPQFSLLGLTVGPFNILWYAMAYIVGLILAWRYAVLLVKRPSLFGGKSPATVEVVDDFLFWATLGVILGGRLGYMFFYQIPYQFDQFLADPAMLIRIWEGGMSFHGGLIGVGLATWHVCKTHKIPLLSMTDIAAAATPIGIFLGRCANFINAELYGRPTEGPMGIVFPQGYGSGGPPTAFDWNTKEWIYSGYEVARHPSQLYEAALEGFLLFIVLAIIIWAFRALKRSGIVTGVFLIGYAIGRSIAEQFREPDAFVEGLPDWLTMGTLLSVPMVLIGGYLIWRAFKVSEKTQPAA